MHGQRLAQELVRVQADAGRQHLAVLARRLGQLVISKEPRVPGVAGVVGGEPHETFLAACRGLVGPRSDGGRHGSQQDRRDERPRPDCAMHLAPPAAFRAGPVPGGPGRAELRDAASCGILRHSTAQLSRVVDVGNAACKEKMR